MAPTSERVRRHLGNSSPRFNCDRHRSTVPADQSLYCMRETTRCISFQPQRAIVTNMSLDSAENGLASCCVISGRTRRWVTRPSQIGAYRLDTEKQRSRAPFGCSDSSSSRIRLTADLASHFRAFCRNSAALCSESSWFTARARLNARNRTQDRFQGLSVANESVLSAVEVILCGVRHLFLSADVWAGSSGR